MLAQFVAKRYKKPVDRAVYFADVVLQMDAKFLGEQDLGMHSTIWYTHDSSAQVPVCLVCDAL